MDEEWPIPDPLNAFLMRVFGRCQMDKVYWVYDGPVIFVVRSPEGVLFLVTYAREDEEEKGWIMAEATRPRLEDLEEGRMTLRDAYLCRQSVLLFETVAGGRWVDPADFGDYLSEEGVYLDVG